MKQIKVSEATPVQLDWLVAKSQGRKEIKIFAPHRPTDRGWIEVRFNPEPKASTARFDPSESWHFAGPIIELEKIDLEFMDNFEAWCGSVVREYGQDRESYSDDQDRESYTAEQESFVGYGPTPLIAVCRCYVASKLGDEAEIPEELE